MKEFPARFSETPTHMGGITGRGAPCYGEDNDYVYGEILGLSSREIEELREQDVI
jgi:crotonobetainyl-CoA:carnitine CoA-transferase CaiB-like acyl-CoA transferase